MFDMEIAGIENLEKMLSYTFRDRSLLVNALVHTSYANENGIEKKYTNQRLEFLGDSVLQTITSVKLYNEYKDADEGLLTRDRSLLVREESLASVARELQLYKFLLLGKGEKKEKIKENNSTLADTLEAIIAAIYLDGGILEAKKFVDKYVLNENSIRINIKNTDNKDYKTKLQEILIKNNKKAEYEVVREKGPAHDKVFYVVCKIDDKVLSEACGKNKKEAETMAAKEIIEKKLWEQ